jgi:PAS domain S-box-containing protein
MGKISRMKKKPTYKELEKRVIQLQEEIVEYQRIRDALIENQDRFRMLYQASFEGLGIHEEGIILEANEALAKMTGHTSSDLIGMNVMNLISPEWHGIVKGNIRFGYEKQYEIVGVRKDGSLYPMEIRGKNVTAKGRELRVISLRDITERKQFEELYRTLAEKSQAGVYIVQDRRFSFLNMNAAQFAGFLPDELIGKDAETLIHPEDRETVTTKTRKMLKGRLSTPIEFRIITTGGRVKWVMQSITSIRYRGKSAILGTVMDITELKKAGERLADLEALEASILDAIPHAVLGFEDRRIIFANNAAESVFGWKPEELIGKNTRVLYQSEADYDDIGKTFYPEDAPKKIHIDKFPCRRKDGLDIICLVSASKFGDGNKKRAVAVYEDITEQVKMDEAFHEERDRAQKYLDMAGAMIIAVDCNGAVTLINQKGCDILRYQQHEILGRNWFETFLPEHVREEVLSVFSQVLIGKVEPVEYFENPVITKDGEERLVSWYNTPIRNEAGATVGILASGEDITERKRAEEKLIDYYERLRFLASELSLTEQRERQKIATELHDRIGQSMAVSKIKLEAMRKDAFSTPFVRPLKELIELMDQLIHDTRSLTFDLSPPVLYILGIEAALEWLAEQFQETHAISVEIRSDGKIKKLDDDIAFFIFRSTQELLVNIAKHAKAENVVISLQRYKKEIHVAIEDDGVGFEASTIEAPLDQADGFGIFSIRERLRYLGGEFYIESKPGRGTRVNMVVPTDVRKRGDRRQ